MDWKKEVDSRYYKYGVKTLFISGLIYLGSLTYLWTVVPWTFSDASNILLKLPFPLSSIAGLVTIILALLSVGYVYGILPFIFSVFFPIVLFSRNKKENHLTEEFLISNTILSVISFVIIFIISFFLYLHINPYGFR